MMNRHAVYGMMALWIMAGCGDAPLGDTGKRIQAVGACNPANSGHDCIHLNGAGVYIAATSPASDFGLRYGRFQWLLTGFTNTSTAVLANGWYEAPDAPVQQDGQVTGAQYLGQSYTVRALSVTGTAVTVSLADGAGQVFPVQGAALADLTLQLRVSDPSSTGNLQFVVRFSAPQTLPGYVEDLTGYSLLYRKDPAGDGIGTGSWSSQCLDPQGLTMPSIFSQGAHWDPASAARTTGSERVTVSCQSGAIATCMLWGYRPWATAERQDNGQAESLADYHQACIHMKRAAYCGDAASYTTPGIDILMADPFDPASSVGEMPQLEAYWSTNGALCLNQPRYPSAQFQGCPAALPPCPADPPAGWKLASGMPQPLGESIKKNGKKSR
jgi:hypothetical protein